MVAELPVPAELPAVAEFPAVAEAFRLDPGLLDPGIPSRFPLPWPTPAGVPSRPGDGAALQAAGWDEGRWARRRAGLGLVQPAPHFQSVAVNLAEAGQTNGPLLESVPILSAAPVACHTLPAAGSLAFASPRKEQVATFCEVASLVEEPRAQPWRHDPPQIWPIRPGLNGEIQIPAAPPTRGLNAFARPAPAPRPSRDSQLSPDLLAAVLHLMPGLRDGPAAGNTQWPSNLLSPSPEIPELPPALHPVRLRVAERAVQPAQDCKPLPAGASVEPFQPLGPRSPEWAPRLADGHLRAREDVHGHAGRPALLAKRAAGATPAAEAAGWSVHEPSPRGLEPAAPLRTDPAPVEPPPVTHLPARSEARVWQPALRPAMVERPAPAEPVPAGITAERRVDGFAALPPRFYVEPGAPAYCSIAGIPATPAGTFAEPCARPAPKQAARLTAAAPIARADGTPASIRFPSIEGQVAPRPVRPAPTPPISRRGQMAAAISPPAALDPVEPVTVEPIPKPFQVALADEPPAPAPLATSDAALRQTLERARRERDGLGYRATMIWRQFVRPALESERGKKTLSVAGVLLVLLLILHGSKTWLRPALEPVFRPMNERSYYLQEENATVNPNAWTDPGLLAPRENGLLEIGEGITLYRPSLPRDDYEFAFEGLVRRGALNWAVRAADSKNYYAFKLTWQGKGKERHSVLVRYAVVDGVAPAPDKYHATTLPFDLEQDRTYHIKVRVFGDRLTTMIDDRGVDSYSDSKLKSGGIAFFAGQEESGLIHSLSVSGNDDTMGRTIYWVRGFFGFLANKL